MHGHIVARLIYKYANADQLIVHRAMLWMKKELFDYSRNRNDVS